MPSFFKPFYLFIFVFIFFGGLGTYVWFYEVHQVREAANQKVVSKDSRTIEDSKITSTVQKIEDEPSALFNDPAIKQAWGLKKADAGRAWSVTKGSRDIVVAVIDTGIDIQHEDIKNNLWKNPGETGTDSKGRNKETNGIDDDGNGFIDDLHGWNFVSSNNKLTDNHGHGTHIAGIIGAEAGNGTGISGISPEVSLMVLKYYDPKVPQTDNLKNTVAAIRYAVKMGAQIINYSGGGTEYSKEEFDVIAEAQKKGILFVAAAGNERSNSDKFHYYPADYELSNIISVTAVDPSVQVLASSNYGIKTVHLAAPGQNILSLLPNNSYGYMTGTSQATAFVTGAAALVMAHKQTYQAEDVKKYILATGDAYEQLLDKTKTARKLNLYKALTVLDQGVGATGVIAVNTINMKTGFSIEDSKDPNTHSGSSPDQVQAFGKSLLNVLSKSKERVSEEKNRGL